MLLEFKDIDKSEETHLFVGDCLLHIPGRFIFGNMISDRNDESPILEGNRKEPRSVRVLPSWMRSSCSKEYPASGASEKVSEKLQGEGTSLQCETQQAQECCAKAVDKASAKFQHIHHSENNVEDDSLGKIIGNDDACEKEDASKANNKAQFKDHTETSEIGLACIDPESINSIDVTSAGNVEQIPLSEERSKKNDLSSNEESVHKASVNSSESEIQTGNHARLLREPCTYGAKCYRKNQTHLDTRSHPGDDDFVDNRPECEYGTSCYRKNVLHNQQYKHTRRIARKRVKPETQAKDSNNDEDSEPEESDISVSDSDSYEPTDSEKSQLSSELEDEGDDDEKEKPKLLKRRRRK